MRKLTDSINALRKKMEDQEAENSGKEEMNAFRTLIAEKEEEIVINMYQGDHEEYRHYWFFKQCMHFKRGDMIFIRFPNNKYYEVEVEAVKIDLDNLWLTIYVFNYNLNTDESVKIDADSGVEIFQEVKEVKDAVFEEIVEKLPNKEKGDLPF